MENGREIRSTLYPYTACIELDKKGPVFMTKQKCRTAALYHNRCSFLSYQPLHHFKLQVTLYYSTIQHSLRNASTALFRIVELTDPQDWLVLL